MHGHIDTAFENGNYRIFDKDDSVLKILLDHRWHGSSMRTKFYPSISERAEDLDILIKAITNKYRGINKIKVIGYSQGASVLLYYLLNDYEQKLKVSSAFLLAPRLDLKAYLKWFTKERERMIVAGETQFSKKYRSKGYVTYTTAYLKEFASIDYFKIIGNLTTPTTLLRGDQDDFLSAEEAARLILSGEGKVLYKEIVGCNHYPKPEQWNDIYNIVYSYN